MAVAESRAGRLFWTRRTSLTTRILAVNIIALGLMAGSLFYLDSYRNQLIAGRFQLASSEAELIADALAETPSPSRRSLLARIAEEHQLRLRLYDIKGRLKIDTFLIAEPSFHFADPSSEPWVMDAARWLDRSMNFVLGSPEIPAYAEPAKDTANAWPELVQAAKIDQAIVVQRAAPDQTPVINAATQVGIVGEMLLSTRNATDITQAVRDARSTLAIVIGVTLLISILLSLFLARTIVRPLRALVRAAVRVRLGRARQPREPPDDASHKPPLNPIPSTRPPRPPDEHFADPPPRPGPFAGSRPAGGLRQHAPVARHPVAAHRFCARQRRHRRVVDDHRLALGEQRLAT